MSAMPADVWAQASAHLNALADGIESRQPDATILRALGQAHACCRDGQAAVRAGAATQYLRQAATAADAWQQVWSRLGADREFRLAVAREARLWAKRLAEQAAPA